MKQRNRILVSLPVRGKPEISMIGQGIDQARLALMYEKVRPSVEKMLRKWVDMQLDDALKGASIPQ